MALLICTSATYSSFCQLTNEKSPQAVVDNNYITFSPIYKEISIGEEVPDLEFTMINYPTRTARLSHFKGKIVILDFWATWCTACIKNMPIMDSLQRLFKDDLQVLLINSKGNRDSEQEVEEFFKNRKTNYGGQYKLGSAVNDTVSDILFPHLTIPHYVIIDRDGKLLVTTSFDQLTVQNISALLKGDKISLRPKNDIDASRPLFLSENIEIENISQYSIFLKGKVDGLGGGNRFRKQGNLLRGRAITNTPLLTLYKIAVMQLFPDFNDRRFVLEVQDPLKLIYTNGAGDKIAWQRENLYTYELIVPLADTLNLYRYMLDDLNRYSNYNGRVEKRKVKCLALITTIREDKIGTKGGKFLYKLYDREKPLLRNAPISSLIAKLNTIDIINCPVIDDTNYKGNIDIEFTQGLTNLDILKKDLQRVGLDLIHVEKEIEMFVIREPLR